MKRRFGIGIIGCGEISAAHGRAYTTLSDYCEIVAMSDTVEAAARLRAAEFGVDTVYTNYLDLLEDERIDAVAICTPHHLHAPMTIAAANAGKHILVEKPMCLNVGEVKEMIAASVSNKVKLTMPSEQVNPRHRFIKEWVLPEIGEISHSYLIDFYYRNTSYYEKARWRGTWAREGGGIFVNQAIYTWDTYQWLLGGVDTAYGYWTNILHPNIEVEDIGYGLVHFRNGTHGKIFATSVCEAPEGTEWMRIQGSKGEIISTLPWLYTIDFSLRDKEKEARLRQAMTQHLARLKGPGLEDEWDRTHDRRVLLQMVDIMQAVQEDRPVTVSPESCGEAMKILNGIHWCGWNYSESFRQWAYLFSDMPQTDGHSLPTVDDAKAQDWRGGWLVERLLDMVKDPRPSLEAPFL